MSDFMVRNGEWLRPYSLSSDKQESWSQAELNPAFISTDGSVWTVVRSYPRTMVIQLINFTSLDSHQRWDEAHDAPVPCEEVVVRIQISKRPAQVLWDCPEQIDGPQAMDFEYSDGSFAVKIPQIHFTGLIAVHE
jgi:hypothetical protein